jgi:hypothetical protein
VIREKGERNDEKRDDERFYRDLLRGEERRGELQDLYEHFD